MLLPLLSILDLHGMNVFRVTADFMHVASIILLILKIRKQKSVAGLSLRTQELYAIVFALRYFDLFWTFNYFYYNTLFKLFYLGTSGYILYMMRMRYRATLSEETFRTYLILGPAFVVALLINQGYSLFEIMWAWSIYIEAVAILPQLFLLQRGGEVEVFTSHYIFCLGGYRGMYLLNWIWRYFTEDHYQQRIVWIAGLIQTGIYCDFFYYYFKSVKEGTKMSLPV
eukprot:TRINITY_DN8991_c0_g1_i1.p1 TRINITY_DN8991_c0_g1~~TRINITY_DN8991_c0_g1_i1.p1  ORF type:complete len:226 (-),score=51.25 TRINITY_DN8991_c0_g1_i1:104-781(-)